MRDHLISSLVSKAKENDNVYLLTGDLGYVVLDEFIKNCPNQYLNVGIAEQNLTSLAAGLAMEGNVVFTYSIGNFPTLRCLEQIRNDICYHNCNVKILAVGGGFVYGNQGITHHATEDLAIMRSLPNMRVYVPGDAVEAVACFDDAFNYNGPAYIRLARNKEEIVHYETELEDISKLQKISSCGNQINIVTTGSILGEGVKLQKMLADKGYSVGLYSVPRLKPMDMQGVEDLAKSCDLLVTLEEHQVCGGLGGCCAEIIAAMQCNHASLLRLGLNDVFSEITGDQDYLRDYYGLSAKSSINTIIDCYRKLKEKKSERCIS